MTYRLTVECGRNETTEEAITRSLPICSSLHFIGPRINKIPEIKFRFPLCKKIMLESVYFHHRYESEDHRKNSKLSEFKPKDRSENIFEQLLDTSITKLEFWNSIVYKFPHEIFRAVNIKVISITFRTHKLDITGLCYCKSLEKLYINYTKNDQEMAEFYIPNEIVFLSNLKSLTIIECNLTTIPASVESLTSLEKLMVFFHGTRSTTFKILCDLSCLSNLKQLTLSGCTIPHIPPSIRLLKELSLIEISNADLNYYPSFLLNMRKLERIVISMLAVSNTLPYIPDNVKEIKMYRSGNGRDPRSLGIKVYMKKWKVLWQVSRKFNLPFMKLARMCGLHLGLPEYNHYDRF